MITYHTGDLLDAQVDALVNTVNTVGVMGKGLALQFKRRFPDNFHRYAEACERNEVVLGAMFVVPVSEFGSPRYIINFPTKSHWRSRSRLTDIETGLDDLRRVVRERGLSSIAVPALGAGNGGLDWPDVKQAIESHLASLADVDVRVFPPSQVHRRLLPGPIQMTWAASCIVELIRSYSPRKIDMSPDQPLTSASHLEIQKLLYFANIAVPALKLDFSRGNYGPYSDAVRRLVQDMEGSFLAGFGDGTGAVQELTPIAPTEGGIAASEQFIQDTGKDTRHHLVEPTLRLVEGFEAPYELELLASTHWAAVRGGAGDPLDAARFIRSWTQRKARIFTDHHIECAWKHLELKQLVPAA